MSTIAKTLLLVGMAILIGMMVPRMIAHGGTSQTVLLEEDPSQVFLDVENTDSLPGDVYVLTPMVPTDDTVSNLPDKPKEVSYGIGNGQCVDYARYVSGIEHDGNAIDWANYINNKRPVVGAVVVLQEGYLGHLAVVTEIRNSTIVIVEQNYTGLYEVSTRELSIYDEEILGYVTE